MRWWLDRLDDASTPKILEVWVRKYENDHKERLVRRENGTWAKLYPTGEEMPDLFTEEEMKQFEEARSLEICRYVNIATADIHKRTWGNAQYLICEGKKAIEWADRECPNNVYRNRLYVVRCPNGSGHIYKDCISVVMRGDFSEFYTVPPEETDELKIPQVKLRETKDRKPDVVREIFL